MQAKYVSLSAVVVLAVAGLATGYIFRGSFEGTTTTTRAIHFTIYESEKGFNDSADFTGAWPIMNVHQGQTVTIRIINSESVEAHGFAIDHYFAGVTLRPGQSHDITFVADQSGTFRVFCNIFCAVHPLMQNGELVVSA